MKRIALVGAGSIGTITGALIAEQGHEIELFDASAAHVEALNAGGARLTGFLDKVVPVEARVPGEVEGSFDLVILLTKQLLTAPALAPFVPGLRDDSVVCTLQNGMPQDVVTSVVGRERTLMGNVQFAATWRAPGESELTTSLEQTRSFAFELGELDGRITDRLCAVAEVLAAVGRCEVRGNIVGDKWSKLVVNATFSGLSAALGCTFGAVMDDSVSARAAMRVMDEAIRVGQASGIEVEGIHGLPIETFLRGGPWTEQQAVEHFTEFISVSRNGEASMLQDLRKGIPSEIDFINGHVIQVAEEHGIDVPFNRAVRDLVSRAAAAGRVPTTEGRATFEALLSSGEREAAASKI